MADIASLVVQVTTKGVNDVERGLDRVSRAAKTATIAVGALTAAAGAVGAALVASQRKFDVMNASLITMTGSAENAGQAMAILQQFAKDTPYGLEQSVNAFTKLVALGLNPSIEAMTSYGNTASAMGKDLEQMIEAVADASTMEFERLKEFGIKANQQGDKIKFTFRGVTTEVAKNADAIQQYLLNIGNTDFAGAMEERSKTLDGAIASLGDTWDGLLKTINDTGGMSNAADGVRMVEDALTELNDSIASGEFKTLLDAAVWTDLKDWTSSAADEFLRLADEVEALSEAWGLSNDAIDDGSTVTENLLVSFAALEDKIRDAWTVYSRFVDDMVNMASKAGDRIKVAFSGGDAIKADIALNEQVDRGIQLQRDLQDLTKTNHEARMRAAIAEGKEQRKNYEEQQKQQRKLKIESLVQQTPKDKDTGDDAKKKKAADKAAKERERLEKQAQAFLDQIARSSSSDRLAAVDAEERQMLDKLKAYREQDVISAAEYEKAKTQIMADAEADREKIREEQKKKEQEEAKKQKAADAYLKEIQAGDGGGIFSEFDELDRQNEIKLEKLKEFYDQGRYLEEDYQAGITAINEQYSLQRANATANVFGNMASSMASSLGEASAAYKAFAIAQATIATYTSAIEAYKSASAIPVVGWVMGPVAAAAAVAAGLANISKIRSAREQGGQLAAGQASTIAERGKFEVIAPASASRVRTAEQMRQMMGEAGGKGNGGDNVVIVNNTTGRIDSSRTERDDEGRLRILIEEHVSSSLQDSNSKISKARRSTGGKPGFA